MFEKLKNRPIYNAAIQDARDKFKNQEPIRRGCSNASCFCSGDCQEIIGWRDKQPDNLMNRLLKNEQH